MLHNNGPYGPNEAPMNVGTPVNMTQINVGSNLNNLGKIAQQPTQAVSGQYNLPNYTDYGQPQLNISPQIHPFSNYQPAGFQANYLAQNVPVHENNWTNGMLPMNLNLQTTHGQNMLNYPTTFNKRPPDSIPEDYKHNVSRKNMPINIPQVPVRTFQKLDNDSGNYDLYNVNQDKFNFVNQNANWNSKMNDKPILDNTRRKSLENTVRLIENILINTTKNKDLQRNKEAYSKTVEAKITDQIHTTVYAKETDKSECEPNAAAEEKNTDNNSQDKSETHEDDMITETEQSSSESEEDVKPVMEKIEIKTEIEQEPIIEVKIEHMDWTDTDFMNPFHRDLNATTREEVCTKVIDCENSVNEAMAIVKSGTKTDDHFECPHCNLLFNHPKRFLIHNKWHTFGLTNDKRMELAREREMKRNQRKEARVVDRMNSMEVTDVVTGKKVYQCKDCEKAFGSKGSLKNHRQRFHPTRVRECKICRKTVVGWMALRAHLSSHVHDAGYQCPDCPKKFKYAHSLAKHRDTHLEKTLSCDQCPKMFGSTAQLKMHQKVHERAQRGTTFRCSYCAKGFYEAYNLSVHERTHRNERPFLCEICNTSFGTNSSLKRHLKVSHSTSKPYECSTCRRSFVTAVIRDRHEMRQHGDPSQFKFPCGLCDCRYMKLKDLQKHVYKAHPKGKRKNKSDSE